jgi:hypothetical protein
MPRCFEVKSSTSGSSDCVIHAIFPVGAASKPIANPNEHDAAYLPERPRRVATPMKIKRFTAVAAAALLSACQGSNGAMPAANTNAALRPSTISHARGAAAVRGAAVKDDLLFLGDSSNNVVRIFDYSHGDKPVGQITMDPESMCADASGNVWIAGNYGGTIALYEFAHDGSGPIAQLPEEGGGDCSINPKSGDIAIIHSDGQYGSAYVDIYHDAQGTAEKISDPNIEDLYFDAYDNRGNLVIQGTNYQNDAYELEYAELPASTHKIRGLTVPQVSYDYAGGLAWDGRYFVAGFDQMPATYQYELSKSSLVKKGEQSYSIRDAGFFGFTIHNQRLAAWAENASGCCNGVVAKFSYPAGGKGRHVQSSGLFAGIALSVGSTTSDR